MKEPQKKDGAKNSIKVKLFLWEGMSSKIELKGLFEGYVSLRIVINFLYIFMCFV